MPKWSVENHLKRVAVAITVVQKDLAELNIGEAKDNLMELERRFQGLKEAVEQKEKADGR